MGVDAAMGTKVASRPALGVFWMLVTGLCFVAVTALVKIMGPRIPAPEAAFIRYLLGLVFLLPMLRPMLSARLSPRQWSLFGARGFVHSFGVMLWFYGMTQIPLAEVTAMNYLSPVYVTIGAALFLGERLAIRRIAAISVALLGAMIILRPGFREVNAGHLAMLVAAVVFAASYLLAKIMVDEVSPAVVVGMLSIWVTICLAPFAVAVWVTPTLPELGILFAVACFATAGHYTMTLAFQCAPMTVTQPVTFLQLVWAVTLGAVAFGEVVDIWVVIGGVVIMASVSFITWREAVLKRKVIAPPMPATKV
ncbi:MAG: DMT family transporter [Paracoccaceae bacterium]